MRLIFIFVILTAVFGESVYGVYLARVGRSTPTKQSGMTLPGRGYLDLDNDGAFDEWLKIRQNDGNGYDIDQYPGLKERSKSLIPPYDRRRPNLRPLSGPFSNDHEYDPSSELPIPFPNLLNSRRRHHLRSNAAPGSQPICKDGNCDINWPDPLSGELNSDNHFVAAASGKWPPSDTNGPTFPSQLSYVQFLSPSSGRRNGKARRKPRNDRRRRQYLHSYGANDEVGESDQGAYQQFTVILEKLARESHETLKNELENFAAEYGPINDREEFIKRFIEHLKNNGVEIS